MKLDNHVVVLTGAASGIGRALAFALAERGCHLALVDRDDAGLRATLATLPARERTYSTHVVDLVDRQAIRDLPAQVLERHDSVQVLINNAGVALGGTFEQVEEKDFDWVMDINFRAVVDSTRAFLPHLRGSGRPGRIVNVSSLYGFIAPPGQAAYSASKFAVRGFSNALRHELLNTPIGVTVVHPGGIATAIAKNARAPAGLSAAEIEQGRKEADRFLRMPPAKAAGIIVRGIEQEKGRVIVGFDALFLSLVERLMPVNYWSLLERLVKRSPSH